MTHPADGGNVPVTAISLIVDGLRRVEESITRLSADVHDQMSRLPELYVPRREVERRFDEHSIDIGEVSARLVEKRASHDADIKDLRACLKQIETDREEDEQQRRRDRQWAIGVAVTVLLALLAIVMQLVGAR